MMGADVIKEPFAVINCDDFYGRGSFQVMGKFLSELPEGSKNVYSMVGFRIGNTLSESGTVSRGLCSTDANNLLTSVVERTKIQRMDGEVKYIDDNGEWTATPDTTPVSMNFWVFADHAQTRPVNFIHIPNLPKCDGAIYIVGDSMYPLLKSGDIVLYKQLKDIGDIFWGDMYLLSIDIDGEEYITVKYIQKSEREGYVKLVSQNPHHADKEVAVDRIRALALVKASIRMNSIR